jgi:hypothetical protein
MRHTSEFLASVGLISRADPFWKGLIERLLVRQLRPSGRLREYAFRAISKHGLGIAWLNQGAPR